MFVVMRLRNWETAFEPTSPIPHFGGVVAHEGCCGFLEVYESAEAALAVYPDAPLCEIHLVEVAREAVDQ